MSRVRAHNGEPTRLGLTLPGFVDRNKIIASLPSLGLLPLAGLTSHAGVWPTLPSPPSETILPKAAPTAV